MTVNVYTTKVLRAKRDLAEKEFLYINSPTNFDLAQNYSVASNKFNELWQSMKTKKVPFRVELEYNRIIQMLEEGLSYEYNDSVLSTAGSIRVVIDEAELKSLLRLLEAGGFIYEVHATYHIGEMLVEYDLDVSM